MPGHMHKLLADISRQLAPDDADAAFAAADALSTLELHISRHTCHATTFP